MKKRDSGIEVPGGFCAPADAARVAAQGGHEDLPGARRIDLEEGLFPHDRDGRDIGIGRIGEARRGGALDAHEHHVPVRSLPAAERAVAGEPLLLRARADHPVDPAIGDEAAARPAAIVEREIAGEMDAAIGGGLRHRPAIGAIGRADFEILDAAPEIDQRHALGPIGFGMDMAVDRNVVGQCAEPGDLREEADIDVEIVAAGLEQDGVARIGEVRAFHRVKDRVEALLQLGAGHGRIGDQDVRAEIGVGRAGGGGAGRRGDSGSGQPGDHRPACGVRLHHGFSTDRKAVTVRRPFAGSGDSRASGLIAPLCRT